MTPEECERQVRALFAPHFPDVERRVVFPERYKRLLELIGDRRWESAGMAGFELRPAAELTDHLDFHFAGQRDDSEAFRRAGAWVDFAGHGSKTWHFLCVDPTMPAYGRVWEGEDANPFMSGGGDGVAFEDWLLEWGNRSWWRHPWTWWLAAVTGGQAASIEEARAAGRAAGVLGLILEALDSSTTPPLHERKQRQPRSGVVVYDSAEVTALFVEAAMLEGDARRYATGVEAGGGRVVAVLEHER